MMTEDEIRQWLSSLDESERRAIFEILRAEFPIHPIEAKLNTRAEVILEAIDRASDLTLRGIRGVIAEAAFEFSVVNKLGHWHVVPIRGDHPYDFLLEDSRGQVRVQVKMQRQKSHAPMMANQAYKYLPADKFAVETQRTRGGKDLSTGEDTRPYRFGDFDILAVSMHPSTNNWESFLYTVGDWLLPNLENQRLLLKFQPVAMRPDDKWTDDFETCVQWFRSGEKKKLL